MNNEIICIDCDITITDFDITAICTLCHNTLCEDHTKSGSKNETLCRDCYRSLMRKKIFKEYSRDTLKLKKELRNINHIKATSKIKLEKKENTRHRLKNQISQVKAEHMEKIKVLKSKIKQSKATNTSLEKALASLKVAVADILTCKFQKKDEFEKIIKSLDSISCEKSYLQSDMHNIHKLIEISTQKEALYINYNKLKTFCCIKCLQAIHKAYKKQLLSSVYTAKSSDNSIYYDKLSTKSLPARHQESCKCEII